MGCRKRHAIWLRDILFGSMRLAIRRRDILFGSTFGLARTQNTSAREAKSFVHNRLRQHADCGRALGAKQRVVSDIARGAKYVSGCKSPDASLSEIVLRHTLARHAPPTLDAIFGQLATAIRRRRGCALARI
jgi:hypothetical protein